MPEHPNAALIRSLFDAFKRQDAARIREIVAEDAVWRFPGRRGKLAGEHRGFEEIAKFLLEVQTLTNGTFALDLEDVTASEDHAVALFTGRGFRHGKRLHNPTALSIIIRNGQAVEFREFVWDLEHVEDFWS
jgi:ketosteroid isomerase-like protein